MSAAKVQELSSHWGGKHAYDHAGKIQIRRVKIDRQGYDPDGKYYGAGPTVGGHRQADRGQTCVFPHSRPRRGRGQGEDSRGPILAWTRARGGGAES
jgi:hypothetical protein